MTIGELFVRLGFKIEGKEDLKNIEAKLKETALTAGKAAFAVDALMAAFLALLNSAMNSAVGFQKFALATGLSTDQLKQWQYTAALANVSSQALTETVKAIQMAGVRVSATGEGYGAWALLGIDPRQNPFTILKQLQTELNSLNQQRVAAARYIVTQAGLSEDIFQMLRRPAGPALPGRYILTGADQAALQALNTEWQRMWFLIGSVKDRFSADFAPAARQVVIWLERGINLLSKFIDWLGRGTPAAQAVKVALIALVAGVGALSIALTALATAASIAAGAAALLNVSFMPLIGTIAGIAGPIAVTVAALTALIALRKELDQYEAKKTGVPGAPHKSYGGGVGEFAAGAVHHFTPWLFDKSEALLDRLTRPKASAGGHSTTVSQNIQVKIDGAQSPERTGSAVVDALRHQLNTAALSAEVPSY
jgi:hypothetical protein